MQIRIERTRCEGHGQCAAAAPSLLHLNDAAEPVLDFEGDVPADMEDEARAAASWCPVGAIATSESTSSGGRSPVPHHQSDSSAQSIS
ncbi:MAG: ferredoxin [Pseudoclavibacter sp.]